VRNREKELEGWTLDIPVGMKGKNLGQSFEQEMSKTKSTTD